MTINLTYLRLRLRQFRCGWRRAGHSWLLAIVPGRIALTCAECAYETPGWVVGGDGDYVQRQRSRTCTY